jgi:hypothetical protein
MIERQELHCHNCSKYVQFNLDTDLDGKHVLKCPNCGHEHCRYVNKGVISDSRWDSRNATPVPPLKFPANLAANFKISLKKVKGLTQVFLSKKKVTTYVNNGGQFVYGNFTPQYMVQNPQNPVPNPAPPNPNPIPNSALASPSTMPIYYIPASNIQCTSISTFATYQGTVGQGTGAGNYFMYQAWMSCTATINVP